MADSVSRRKASEGGRVVGNGKSLIRDFAWNL